MKIIKIFGAVLALHGLAFLLIFANPGCSSTKKGALSGDTPAVAAGPERGPMINLAAVPTPPITLATAAPVQIGFDPDAPAVSGMERYSPRRPGPESAAPATPAPEAAPVKTYTVVGGDSLWTIAKKNDLTVADLSRANNLAANAVIHPGQKLVIPTKNTPAAAAGGTAAAANTYRVRANETLSGIAKRAGIPTATLRELNALKSDTLRFGQELKLPPGVTVGPDTPAPKPGDNVYTHTVQPGETLEMIARKYGLKQAEIGTANNITNPALIRAGSTLVIPGWQQTGAKGPAPEATPKAAPVPGPGQDLGAGLKSVPAAATPIRIDTPIQIGK
jgi:LysM repeat protein